MEDALTVGERNLALARRFAAREGVVGDCDSLPERLRRPVPDGPGSPDVAAASLSAAQLDAMRAEYYRRRGWTADGISAERLRDLGLSDCP
jgi:aldehyde:ferredoxin oxidoreductase